MPGSRKVVRTGSEAREMFRKHPHGNRVRKVLENPGHPPAAESSGCCWRQCRAAWAEAARVCWDLGWCCWRGPEASGLCWSVGQSAGLAGTVARGYCSYAGTVAPDASGDCWTRLGCAGQNGLEQPRAWGSRKSASTLEHPRGPRV